MQERYSLSFHHKVFAAMISALFVLMGVVYSVTTPVFEALDEIYHYPYIKHLADGNGLPVQNPDRPDLWEQEGSQPPLYYVVMAALTRWVNTDDLSIVRRVNPHARVGVPLSQDNKNMVIHTDRESFPWQGVTLAVHLARLFSLFMGLGTVLCTYHIVLLIFPKKPIFALGAMAFNAFNPMFIFVSASTNNDNLVILLSSIVLFILARLLHSGKPSALRLLTLGGVIGLACLSKLSGLALIPLAALALVLRPMSEWKHRPESVREWMPLLREWLCECITMFAPVLLVAGWWYYRNLSLYGDPLGLNAMLDIVGRRENASTLPGLWGEFRGFRMSFWGLMGAVNVLLQPLWVYRLLDIVMALAIAGVLKRFARLWRAGRLCRDWQIFTLLACWILLVLVALLRWTIATKASQGRLVFPAISAISLFFVLGLTAWLPLRRQMFGASILAALLLTLAAVTPFSSIRPAYARSPILTEADVPVTAHPFQATYGGAMRLLAFDIAPEQIEPGGSVAVTLYWQALAPMDEDYSIYIHLFGWRGERLGQRDTYPGRGMYPTTMWTPGQVVRDTFLVPVRKDAYGPTAVTVEVGLYQLETMKKLSVIDAQGKSVGSPVLARLKLAAPTTAQAPGRALEAQFGQAVRLRGYDLDTTQLAPGIALPLTLHWHVTGELDRDYTVFIHLESEGNVAAQGDGPPLEGLYPTSLWGTGESLADEHILRIPPDIIPGNYRLLVGFYDLVSGQRLPVVDAAGNMIGDHVVIAELSLPAQAEP